MAKESDLLLAKQLKMMKTNIQIFKNEVFGEIRTMTNEKGETFFVGKDVAQALGYSNSRKALLDHVDEEDKGVTKRDTLGGKQQLIVINESGLYALILSSKLVAVAAARAGLRGHTYPCRQYASGHAGLHPRGREPIERSGAGLTTHAEPAQTQAGTATGRGSGVNNDY